MKRGTKIALGLGGLVVVGGIAAAVSGAEESTRHGMKMTGNCEEFDIVDPQEWNTFAEGQMGRLFGEGVVDADQMIVAVYASAFPECPWPPREGTVAREVWDMQHDAAVLILQTLINVMMGMEGASAEGDAGETLAMLVGGA